MEIKSHTIALVIGQGGYNDMGLIRSCGEAEMDVVCICPPEVVIPIYRSRYVKHWIPRNIRDKESLVKTIIEVKDSHPGCQFVLYPASDLIACLADESTDELHDIILLPNANGQLRRMMDKAVMAQLAANNGLMVPHSLKIDLSVDKQVDFELPCIVKPLRSISGEKGDITICRNKNELTATLGMYRHKGFYDVLLQQFISGENQEEVAVTGVSLPSGQIVIRGMIHKRRIVGNGSTVFARFDNNGDDNLNAKIVRYIKATGYSGIFDIEFLHNSEGYFFIECNFRNGAYGYAVTKSGFNMPALFASVINPSDIKGIKSVVFMEERSDLRNVLNRTVSPIRWIYDFISTDTLLWWNWRDPRPMLRIPYFIKKYFK